MPKVTTTAYIINNKFSNNPCDVPIVCGNYSVLGYGWFVRVSNVFSNGCGGYFEIGTEIQENYTVGHDPSEFIKLLHVQSGSTNIWVSETVDELINLCKCTPTNFTLIVDNGDGTYTAIFPTGSGLPDVTWGSGGGSGFDGEVLISADLPDPTLHTDEIWFVKTGVDAGPYYSDGVTWFSPITGILSNITTLQGETNLLLNNVTKILYYEIVSGASGTITPPVGATINADEFGDSGNSILSKINVANKPTIKSPQTAGGVVVTANLNTVTGAWTASGVYTDAQVALVYSISITDQFKPNLNQFYVIEEVEINNPSPLSAGNDTNIQLVLGGSFATALLAPASISVVWSGTLADGRIASAATWNAKQAAYANLSSIGALVNAAGALTNDGAGNFSYAAPSSSQWITSGSDIYYSIGNVGIGTSSPGTALDVNGVLTLRTAQILTDSVNGSDNKELAISSANAIGVDRGAFFALEGNEVASIGGSILFGTGDVSSGKIEFRTGNYILRQVILQNGDIGMGVASPSAKLHLEKTTEQLRIGYDGSNYLSTTVGITGIVTFDAVGSGASFVFSDKVGVIAPAPATNLSLKGSASTKILSVGGKDKEFYLDSGNLIATGETDLYVRTFEANLFGANGDTVYFSFTTEIVGAAVPTKRLKIYFGGTNVYDSTAQVFATGDVVKLKGEIIRVSATVVRVTVEAQLNTGVALTKTMYTEVTGLTLSSTNIFKLTGESSGVGSANDDIVAKMGFIRFEEVSQ